MGEDRVADQTWLLHVHIPDVSLPHLVAQSQDLLRFVHWKSHKPDLAVFEADFVDNTDFVLSYFAIILIQSGVHTARFPTDDGVLARFWQNKITKPAAAVNIIPVNVSGAEVREMAEFSRENFLCF